MRYLLYYILSQNPFIISSDPVQNSSSNSCVICHKPIELTNFGMGKIILEQNYVGCPNAHLAHRDCLKRWVVHSQNCPVCHEKYDIKIINIFEEYLVQREADKKQAEEKKKQLEEEQKHQELKDQKDPEFEAKFNQAENLARQQNFMDAMLIYWDILDHSKFLIKDPRRLRVILHLSLSYYKMGKYAQCIRQLTNLIKIDYNYPLAFYFLGMTYEQLEMHDKIKWAYDRSKVILEKLVEKNKGYNKYLEIVNSKLNRL